MLVTLGIGSLSISLAVASQERTTMELAMDQKIAIVSKFLLASPAGEVNDVFNDIRTIIQDDAALEAGIAPALEQYNIEQFTVAELHGTNEPVLICKASQSQSQPKRFIDPRSKQSFDFDHVQLKASDLQPIQVDDELELYRSALDSAATSYAANHYSQGVASVYSLSQPESRPALPSTEEPSIAEPKEETADAEEAVDSETTDPAIDEDAKEPAETTEAPPQIASCYAALPKQFGIYLVGNRYNPSNFWTGRWRSNYEVDLENKTVKGLMQVNVHYYEQGNVQMHASLPVEFELSTTSSDASTIAKEVIKKISASEREYQISLNDAYGEMSEKTFKELRRALPVHKQKLDWNRITSYKLTSELKKA